ncbi:MAG: hypothetical protein MJA82_12750 [Clostridia bacterium]|nr:hypothetical protein [Clostridia bacterium]
MTNDIVAAKPLGISAMPDHSTFCIRIKEIEKSLFYQIYKIFVILLNPDLRICCIDSTALRSSKFDSEVKLGKSTHLGMF